MVKGNVHMLAWIWRCLNPVIAISDNHLARFSCILRQGSITRGRGRCIRRRVWAFSGLLSSLFAPYKWRKQTCTFLGRERVKEVEKGVCLPCFVRMHCDWHFSLGGKGSIDSETSRLITRRLASYVACKARFIKTSKSLLGKMCLSRSTSRIPAYPKK